MKKKTGQELTPEGWLVKVRRGVVWNKKSPLLTCYCA
jgi:hypothetical protein